MTLGSDRRLEGIAESGGSTAEPGLRIRFGTPCAHGPEASGAARAARPCEGSNEYLRILRAGDGSYLFRFDNGARFDVCGGGRCVTARWPPDIGFQDVSACLLGPVLGFVARLRGTVCLHASAVLVDGAAVAFLAPGGSGKSTLCAYFAQRGHRVLTDDVLALARGRGGFRAHAGPARIRLWPDAARAILGGDVDLPRVFPSDPHWDKRYRDYPSHRPAARLVAIYTGEGHRPGAPRIAACSGRDAFLRFAANRYPVRVPVPGQGSREFAVLAALAERVPLRRIRARSGLPRLGAVYDAVREDLRRLAANAARAGSVDAGIAC